MHAPAPGPAPQGDALTALWQAHRRFVAAILLAHAPRGADLDDLLQEVGMVLVRCRGQLRALDAFLPWVRTIARNVAISAGRRARRHGALFAKEPPDGESLGDPRQRGDAAAQREEASYWLARIQELPDEYREPLVLRSVDGLSQREIAEALGLPETTVETRLARARRMLRASANARALVTAAHDRPVPGGGPHAALH
ncbi:MAG: sigma-70 family RNA polymerase sigma factor [Planctomycetes bacterium]|nr:sigma-70 family RNA polymerase sigma factor [Planctomycetota bacterium]